MKNKLPLIFLLFTTTCLQAQWEMQLDVQNFMHFDRIHFIDENLGWAIGGATIGAASPYFYTTDGGENWYVYEDWMAEDNWGTDIVFVNPDTGFIAAPNGIIHKTINGGETWTDIQTPATQNVVRLCFVDENNGWATLGQYSEGYILHTEDCGVNWELQDVIPESNLGYIVSLFFLNDSTGWGGGGITNPNHSAMLKKTIDNGEAWITQYETNQYYWFFDIYFSTSENGWIVGSGSNQNYLILHTEDGGETWNEQVLEENSYGLPARANCVFFINDTIGWIGTGEPYPTHPFEGSVYLTTDGGVNWNLQQEFYQGIFDIQMLDQDTGWAVGGDYIYHTTNGDTIIITGVNEKIHKKDFIKISPNPTNGIFTINTNNKLSIINYQLTDIKGKEIMSRGQVPLQIDISNQPNGIYFLTIKYNTNNQINSLTKKIIKL